MVDYALYTAEVLLPACESGRPLGNLPVPSALAEIANIISDKFFTEAEANDFCDELVDVAVVPEVFRFGLDWVPHHTLALMGLKATDQQHFVFTSGVEPHIDDIYQLCIMWVLRADQGMAFRSTGADWVRHQVGDWYLFDDRVEHEVEIIPIPGEPEPAWRSMYCAWCIKLEAL